MWHRLIGLRFEIPFINVSFSRSLTIHWYVNDIWGTGGEERVRYFDRGILGDMVGLCN